MLDRGFFNILVKELPMQYRKHIFDPAGNGQGAKNVEGGNYPQSYSEPYGTNKKARLLKRQHRKYGGSFAPVASGDLLKDFKTSNSGFISGGMGFGFITDMGKVKSLLKSGRPLSTKANPLPKPVEKWIMKEADKYVGKKLNKIKGGTFTIKT